MKKQLSLLCLTALLLLIPGEAWAQKDCWIQLRSGKTVKGYSIKARPDGTLILKTGKGRRGATRTIGRGSYKQVHTPKPPTVAALERLDQARNYDELVAKTDAALKKYRWLGWGGLIVYLKGKALMRLGKALEKKGSAAEAKAKYKLAKKVFTDGKPYAKIDGRAKLLGRAVQEAKLALNERVKPLPGISPFKFKLKGQFLEKQGKKREAALEYLKVVLLYDVDKGGFQRKECYGLLVALLKELGDLRHRQFKAQMRKEY